MSAYCSFSVTCPICSVHCFEVRGLARDRLKLYLEGSGKIAPAPGHQGGVDDHTCVCGAILIPDELDGKVLVSAYWPPEFVHSDDERAAGHARWKLTREGGRMRRKEGRLGEVWAQKLMRVRPAKKAVSQRTVEFRILSGDTRRAA